MTAQQVGGTGRYDLINEGTGEIYIEAGDEVTAENLEKLDKAGVDRLELLDIDYVNTGPWIRNTLKADKAEDGDQALSDIYRVMRPGEPPTRETADALFYGLFFDPERYDLSAVGRVKLNMRLGLDGEVAPPEERADEVAAGAGELDHEVAVGRQLKVLEAQLCGQAPADRPALGGQLQPGGRRRASDRGPDVQPRWSGRGRRRAV